MSGVVRLAAVAPLKPDTCSTCWFCVQGAQFKECRRHAPKPSAKVGFSWPLINDYDWCGEFRRAAAEPGA